MSMTNRWNRVIYRLWAPVYDLLFDRLLFAAGRRRLFEVLQLRGDEQLLLVGVGTGADLTYLPPQVRAVGLDLSQPMLRQAAAKIERAAGDRLLVLADAQSLPVRDGAFDVVILSLILSVVPDGRACWQESLRALRPGGRAIIFDKFLPEHQTIGPLRAALNPAAKVLGTDINRRLADILAWTQHTVRADEPSLLRGMYRIIVIETPGSLSNRP